MRRNADAVPFQKRGSEAAQAGGGLQIPRRTLFRQNRQRKASGPPAAGLPEQIVAADIAQGSENMFLGPWNLSVDLFSQEVDIPASGRFPQRTGGADRRESQLPADGFDLALFQIGERPDERQTPGKQILAGNHCADVAGAGQIEQKGFDDVVAVVAEGDGGATVVAGMGKKLGAPAAGALKTEIMAARTG